VGKLLISGGDGKLTQQVIKYNEKYEIMAPSKFEMDITDRKSVEGYVEQHNPDLFLHTAAYTRPMKKHQENPNLSLEINIIGTANVALACMKYNVKLIYVSTDYVYPGNRGNYKETDPVSPYRGNNDGITKYGWSKMGGECATNLVDNSLILRLCMSNRPFPHELAAIDIRKSYLYEDEAAQIILKLLEERGIINVGGASMSVHEFARQETPGIGKINALDIKEVKIAPDTTMDTSKMKKILRDRSEE